MYFVDANVQNSKVSSFPPLHEFHTHFLQAILGFASRKFPDRRDCFVGVFLGKCAGLVETVALCDNLTSLKMSVKISTTRLTTYLLYIALLSKLSADQLAKFRSVPPRE
jgi:hypothetical protein